MEAAPRILKHFLANRIATFQNWIFKRWKMAEMTTHSITFRKRKEISAFYLFRLDIGIAHRDSHSVASEIWEGDKRDEVKSIYKPLAIALKEVSLQFLSCLCFMSCSFGLLLIKSILTFFCRNFRGSRRPHSRRRWCGYRTGCENNIPREPRECLTLSRAREVGGLA